eukprot:EG_transcript_28948
MLGRLRTVDGGAAPVAPGRKSEERQQAELQERYAEGLRLLASGEAAEAVRVFRDVLAKPAVARARPRRDEPVQSHPLLYLKLLALKNQARALQACGEAGAATEVLVAALALDGGQPALWFSLAQLALRQRQVFLARLALEECLKLNPHHLPAAQLGLEVLHAVGDFPACHALAAGLLQRNPLDSQALLFASACGPDCPPTPPLPGPESRLLAYLPEPP